MTKSIAVLAKLESAITSIPLGNLSNAKIVDSRKVPLETLRKLHDTMTAAQTEIRRINQISETAMIILKGNES